MYKRFAGEAITVMRRYHSLAGFVA
jgi:hypothetical protein